MGSVELSMRLGLLCLGASIAGGIIAGAFEHWLASAPEPPRDARWRVGPRRLMAKVRRELEQTGRKRHG
jgi:hypothetical protein